MGSMAKGRGLAERRQHERFKVHGGAFAVLRPRSEILGQVIDIVGEIVDISQGGLMFRYIVGEHRSHHPFELDIVLAGDDFRLDKIPFRAASDRPMAGQWSFSPTTVRRQGVQFGVLTDDQKAQLKYFIQTYATDAVQLDYYAPIKDEGQSLSYP